MPWMVCPNPECGIITGWAPFFEGEAEEPQVDEYHCQECEDKTGILRPEPASSNT